MTDTTSRAQVMLPGAAHLRLQEIEAMVYGAFRAAIETEEMIVRDHIGGSDRYQQAKGARELARKLLVHIGWEEECVEECFMQEWAQASVRRTREDAQTSWDERI